MNLNLVSRVTKGFSKVTGKVGFAAKAKSPEILLILGISGMVGAAVLTHKAALKVEDVLDEHKEKVDKINACWQKVQDGDIDQKEYSEEDKQKDLVVTYTQTAVDFIKLYGPPVALGAISIGLIIKGHNILKARNMALVAAYKGLDEAFKAYRNRVVAEHGSEADYRYRHGLKAVEVVEPAYTDKDGNEHPAEVKKKYIKNDDGIGSVYAKEYNKETSKCWNDKRNDYNLYFLYSQQAYWNSILELRGHVFLNEVYDNLGLERTPAGAVVGWKLGPGRDCHIDFGIFEGDTRNLRNHVNPHGDSFLLDFNVDGVIIENFKGDKIS